MSPSASDHVLPTSKTSRAAKLNFSRLKIAARFLKTCARSLAVLPAQSAKDFLATSRAWSASFVDASCTVPTFSLTHDGFSRESDRRRTHFTAIDNGPHGLAEFGLGSLQRGLHFLAIRSDPEIQQRFIIESIAFFLRYRGRWAQIGTRIFEKHIGRSIFGKLRAQKRLDSRCFQANDVQVRHTGNELTDGRILTNTIAHFHESA